MLSETRQSGLEILCFLSQILAAVQSVNFSHSFAALLLITSRFQISVMVYKWSMCSICHDSGIAIVILTDLIVFGSKDFLSLF